MANNYDNGVEHSRSRVEFSRIKCYNSKGKKDKDWGGRRVKGEKSKLSFHQG